MGNASCRPCSSRKRAARSSLRSTRTRSGRTFPSSGSTGRVAGGACSLQGRRRRGHDRGHPEECELLPGLPGGPETPRPHAPRRARAGVRTVERVVTPTLSRDAQRAPALGMGRAARHGASRCATNPAVNRNPPPDAPVRSRAPNRARAPFHGRGGSPGTWACKRYRKFGPMRMPRAGRRTAAPAALNTLYPKH